MQVRERKRLRVVEKERLFYRKLMQVPFAIKPGVSPTRHMESQASISKRQYLKDPILANSEAVTSCQRCASVEVKLF